MNSDNITIAKTIGLMFQKLKLILLSIFCPIASICLISRKRPELQKKTWVQITLSMWAVFWFLGIGIALAGQPNATTQTNATSQLPITHIANNNLTDNDNDGSANKNNNQSTNENENDSVSFNQKLSDSTPSVKENNKSEIQPAPQDTDVMSGISVKEAENVPFDRSRYQPDWSVNSGCDIRSRILSSTSSVAVQYSSNGCTVSYGSWSDPYTGQTLTGNPYRGDGTANDLDIDHIIPLNYVNSHGGYYWPDSQKRAYGASLTAMDNGVYLAVSASENRKKSDKGPSAYYPPNSAYRCEYSRKWRDIARSYAISLSLADYNLIASVLVSCGIN